MEVQVRWFAAFREQTGVEAEIVDTAATSPAQLFDELKTAYPALGRRDNSLVAINDEMADWQDALQDGDTVLFFPPVAGG